MDNLSSNFQSSIFEIILLSWVSTSPNRSIWLADLFSKIFLVLVIKFGIELNSDCLLIFRLSNAPALTNPSNCNLFISFGFTLSKKSVIDLNFPFSNLSLTIFDIASYPTALIPPKA